MSISLAQGQPDSVLVQIAAVLGCVGVAVSIAAAAGVFHRRSIVGPPRLAGDEGIMPVWLTLFIGFSAWIFVQQVYVSTRTAAQSGPATTVPATQIVLSPRETVAVGVAGQVSLLAGLIGASVMIRPRGLWRLGFGLRSLTHALVPGLISIAVVIPFMYAAMVGTQHLWEWVGLEHPSVHPLLRAMREQTGLSLRATIIISALFLAPPAEELLFRGHLQTALAYALAGFGCSRPTEPGPALRWAAILLASGAFALVHPGLWMMPPIFLLSVCIGYVYERTGNLWVPILIHMAFNGFNLLNFWSQLSP